MSTATTSPAHRAASGPETRRADLSARAGEALDRAVDALLAGQHESRPWGAPGAIDAGAHWCAQLEGDSILSSEYLLMKAILGQEHEDRATLLRIANHLRLTQRPDGTWGQYPGSPPDPSACVKGYFALKIFGDHPDEAHMARARERILELGGAERINTFSMFYLACLGQVSWEACPAIPPEVVFLPRWFPFHIDKVSAWTRTMILPLAICTAVRPVRDLPPELGIDELFIDQSLRRRLNQPWDTDNPASLKNVFLAADRALKIARRLGLTPGRARALRAARRWLIERMSPETTEGLGAIFPPMVYIQVALSALGLPRDHPAIKNAEVQLDAFFIDAPHEDPRLDHVRIQPCFSPVWDTGIALYALTEAGLTAENCPHVAAACDWLRAVQVRRTGDWIRNLRPEDRSIRLGIDAAAWAFEYRNDWYPDVDDTAMVAMALMRAGDRAGQSANHDTARMAFRWIRAMHNDDGGWAAFDRTTDRPWMELIPFADHNAMQDPSCPDITGRTIESLITCGLPPAHPTIRSAVAYILSKQEPEGCWFGRWGVNYIYGTWQAVGGLHAAGLDASHPQLRKTLDWLRSIQNANGGFGESANSYLDRSLMGVGPSTASQTAWGLTTLLYLVAPTDPALERAVRWLIDHQLTRDKAPFEPARLARVENSSARLSRADRSGDAVIDPGSDQYADRDWVSDRAGAWNEHWFTGTGFPKVFYLRYHLYRHYFPVMALARYRNCVNQRN